MTTLLEIPDGPFAYGVTPLGTAALVSLVKRYPLLEKLVAVEEVKHA